MPAQHIVPVLVCMQAQEVERRRDVVDVGEDPLVAGEREPELNPMAHVEPREVDPDAGKLRRVGIGTWGAVPLAPINFPRLPIPRST